jgi:hypothetical protein
MLVESARLKNMVNLCKEPFEKRFLEIKPFRDKEDDSLASIFHENNCIEASQAFKEGLLDSFKINGLKSSKVETEFLKVGEYAEGKSNPDMTYSGNMNITFVYESCSDGLFIACSNHIVFPVIVICLPKGEYGKLLMKPYISTVKVWASDNSLDELMQIKLQANTFHPNSTIEEDLYEHALAIVNNLGEEGCRYLMYIDNGIFLPKKLIDRKDINP